MCIRTMFSAVAGAVVVFAWTSASWMLLPWHNWDLKDFKKDGVVITESIKVETLENGLYILPKQSHDVHSNPDAQKAWAEKAMKGPFVFMSVNTSGMKWDMNTALVIQFITQLIVALGAAWLLARSTVTSLFGCAFFVSMSVTLGALLTNIAGWNWWGFPLTTTLVSIADVIIGWFLGGFVMGLFRKRA